MSRRVSGTPEVRATEGKGETQSNSDDGLCFRSRRRKVLRTNSRNSPSNITAGQTYEATREAQHAQSEEDARFLEFLLSRPEVEEHQENKYDNITDEELLLEYLPRQQEVEEHQENKDDNITDEELLLEYLPSQQEVEEDKENEDDICIEEGQEGRSSTSVSRKETGREEDAQSEQVDEHQSDESEQEVEEDQQNEEDEEHLEDGEDEGDDDEIDVVNELTDLPLNVRDQQGCHSTSASREGCNTVITLTDSSLLDCPICFEPLTIPVYQCDQNGHVACSLCCIKINNKCPFCSCPIGGNRCRAIENIVGSCTTPCQNSKYGCNVPVIYNKMFEHEMTCACSPCSCPHFGCKFVSSAKELYQHYSNCHPLSAIDFWFNNVERYNFTFTIMLRKTDNFLVLQESPGGTLFILYNRIEVLGNVVTVSCIQPSFMDDFYYDLLVTNKGSTLKFQSVTRNMPNLQVDGPSPTSFLLIPSEFFSSCGQVQITVSISTCIP